MFDTVGEAVAAYRAANAEDTTLDIRRDWDTWKALHERRHTVTYYLRARGCTDLLFPLAMEQATIRRRPDEHSTWVARTDELLAHHTQPAAPRDGAAATS